MTDFETIVSLLALAGEATLGIAMMQCGILEKQENYGDLPVPSIRRDENHVAVIQLGDRPERLVFDDDFGWLWYNAAEGPDDNDVPA